MNLGCPTPDFIISHSSLNTKQTCMTDLNLLH